MLQISSYVLKTSTLLRYINFIVTKHRYVIHSRDCCASQRSIYADFEQKEESDSCVLMVAASLSPHGGRAGLQHPVLTRSTGQPCASAQAEPRKLGLELFPIWGIFQFGNIFIYIMRLFWGKDLSLNMQFICVFYTSSKSNSAQYF